MEQFNIIDYKSKIDSLTTLLMNEYIILEKKMIDIQQLSTKELSEMNHKITSINSLLHSKENLILSLQLELDGYKSREEEYKKIIDNNNYKVEPETEVNKFDLLRGQAKEISAKDKEIERLTKELQKFKDVKHDLSMVIKEDSHLETKGWSPTTSKTPTPTSSNTTNVDESDESDEKSEESFYVITYRKHKYYRDTNNKVYDMIDGDEVGPHIGNWVKNESGKFKVVKH